jgi:hypothetical protein
MSTTIFHSVMMLGQGRVAMYMPFAKSWQARRLYIRRGQGHQEEPYRSSRPGGGDRKEKLHSFLGYLSTAYDTAELG